MLTHRKAVLSDCRLIHELAWQIFPETYKNILSREQIEYMMEWMYSEQNLRRQMLEEGHVYFLAYREERCIGYVSVQPESEHVFHLQKIYVLPSEQGTHGGRYLFQVAVDYIRRVHPEPCEMRLNVNRSNKALGFYRHMGMRIDCAGDFPIGNGYYMNDYVMTLAL